MLDYQWARSSQCLPCCFFVFIVLYKKFLFTVWLFTPIFASPGACTFWGQYGKRSKSGNHVVYLRLYLLKLRASYFLPSWDAKLSHRSVAVIIALPEVAESKKPRFLQPVAPPAQWRYVFRAFISTRFFVNDYSSLSSSTNMLIWVWTRGLWKLMVHINKRVHK